MTTRNASCLAEFSLSPLFRRKWSSTYEALEDSRPNRNKLMKRYIEEITSSRYVLLAIDHTAWGRRGAKTLKDRTYEPIRILKQISNSRTRIQYSCLAARKIRKLGITPKT
ncbi:MAG: hypothetical protein QNJ72_45430 [Pleurocapsa sp. MO_226.B13]|nr:hypothetical protein [Pleurocapsa sp. MO_226.B13]